MRPRPRRPPRTCRPGGTGSRTGTAAARAPAYRRTCTVSSTVGAQPTGNSGRLKHDGGERVGGEQQPDTRRPGGRRRTRTSRRPRPSRYGRPSRKPPSPGRSRSARFAEQRGRRRRAGRVVDRLGPRRDRGRRAVDHRRAARHLLGERAEQREHRQPCLPTSRARAVASPPPRPDDSTSIVTRSGLRRREVVRRQRQRWPAGGVGHRPRRDRQEVAAVRVAADVPPRRDVGVVPTVVSPGTSVARLNSRPTRHAGPYGRRPVHDTCERSRGAVSVASWGDEPVLCHDADLLRQRRAAPRACVHDDRRRRAHPVAPAAGRRRQVPHRHRRARPQDPAGRRRRRPVAAGLHRRDRAEVRTRLGSAEHRQRRLHPHHRAAPQAAVVELLQRCYDAGDIELGVYSGKYCVSCEEYYTDDELHRDRRCANCCPIHRRPVDEYEEENYFFRLSRFQDRLLDWYAAHPGRDQARAPRQRGARTDPRWPPRLLGEPHEPRVGHPAPVGPPARGVRVVRRAHELPVRGRLRRSRPGLHRLVAGRLPPHRQGHHPAPLRVLAGDAHVGRRRAAEGLGRRRLAARRRREDGQVGRQRRQPARPDRHRRRRRIPLLRPRRDAVRHRRRLHLRRSRREATTATSPTTSATCTPASPPSSRRSAAASGRHPAPTARSPRPRPRRTTAPRAAGTTSRPRGRSTRRGR